MSNKSIQLSILIPTLNEADNVIELTKRIFNLELKIPYNIIFIDDGSNDLTVANIRKMQQENDNIFLLRRFKRKGLSSAIIEGALFSQAELICVMDADLQHDEAKIPEMLQKINEADIVVASRYSQEGEIDQSWSKIRKFISNAATFLSSFLLGKNKVSDPMSGFFLIKREILEKIEMQLKPEGFKILFDIISCSKKFKIKEVSYSFKTRIYNQSKLNHSVLISFVELFITKFLLKLLPHKFALFCFVGTIGLIVNIITMMLLKYLNYDFLWSQLIVSTLIIFLNYILNNIITFRDNKLFGIKFIEGLIKFFVTCFLGLACNLAISYSLYNIGINWYMASVIGVLFSSVWNFGLSLYYVWK
jgi:dolichol-phosphate mannosyltransferase